MHRQNPINMTKLLKTAHRLDASTPASLLRALRRPSLAPPAAGPNATSTSTSTPAAVGALSSVHATRTAQRSCHSCACLITLISGLICPPLPISACLLSCVAPLTAILEDLPPIPDPWPLPTGYYPPFDGYPKYVSISLPLTMSNNIISDHPTKGLPIPSPQLGIWFQNMSMCLRRYVVDYQMTERARIALEEEEIRRKRDYMEALGKKTDEVTRAEQVRPWFGQRGR